MTHPLRWRCLHSSAFSASDALRARTLAAPVARSELARVSAPRTTVSPASRFTPSAIVRFASFSAL